MTILDWVSVYQVEIGDFVIVNDEKIEVTDIWEDDTDPEIFYLYGNNVETDESFEAQLSAYLSLAIWSDDEE